MMRQVLDILLVILDILIILLCISYTVSFWFIFKKEDIKENKALIPFVNVYHIFRLVDIPFYTIFIPLINLIVLALVPYKLLKRYNQPKWMMNLSIIFPYVFMVYIAFSKECVKPKEINKQSINTLLELDNVVNNLNNNAEIPDFFFGENIDTFELNRDYHSVSKTEKMIEKIEQNAIADEYFFENEIVNEKIEQKNVNDVHGTDDNIEEIIEIFDQEGNNLLASNIDSIEEKLEESNKNNDIAYDDDKEYKEYKEDSPEIISDKEIAFGGTSMSNSQNEELKCSRCGSSLVGSNGYCPGCGLKL